MKQYCRVCDDQREFYYLGRQEGHNGYFIDLYNCFECGSTQIKEKRDSLEMKVEIDLEEENE